MPIRLPLLSTSAPPELPGLIAASVWMKSSNRLMPRWLRPSALTMPCVTVLPKPNGLPIASTTSPTCKPSTVAERDRRQVVAVDLEHGEVGFGIDALDASGHLTTIGQHDFDVVGAVDHVMVGEHVTVG